MGELADGVVAGGDFAAFEADLPLIEMEGGDEDDERGGGTNLVR